MLCKHVTPSRRSRRAKGFRGVISAASLLTRVMSAWAFIIDSEGEKFATRGNSAAVTIANLIQELYLPILHIKMYGSNHFFQVANHQLRQEICRCVNETPHACIALSRSHISKRFARAAGKGLAQQHLQKFVLFFT